MLRLAAITVLLATGLAVLGGVGVIGSPGSLIAQSVPAQEAWQKEFDDICSKTQEAMTFTGKELASLISRCDALRPQLEKLDETRKKIYLGRLRMCRGLYADVLDSKQAVDGPKTSTARSPASETWQTEFDNVCSRTDDAMTFSQEELASLVSRCDALQVQIDKLDPTRKKVYQGRLRMCRGLYAYVLDSKRNAKK